MSELEELLPYDDENSLTFIQNYLPQDFKGSLSDDDIYYIVDTMYDYYESSGFFTEEDGIVDIDEEKIVEYVCKQIKKDGFPHITDECALHVVKGELEYCESIGMFE